MACSGFTITYTGGSPTTITFDDCDISPCTVTLDLVSGDSYYINTSSVLSDYTDIEITDVVIGGQKYNFSSVCDDTVFHVIGEISDTPFDSGNTYCFSAYNCTSAITVSGCYTLIIIGDSSFPQYSWISEPTYGGPSSGECLASCPCSPPFPCSNEYCISYTNTEYDGNYTYAGEVSGNPYWTGDGLTTYYIYNNGNEWCLSNALFGECFLSGKSPCTTECPDLCDSFFSEGICSTTTTTTSPCLDFDVDAIFNCEVTPTPSSTPTPTPTPTIPVTPSATNFCSVVGVDASIISFSPTPTPTLTPTPTSSAEVVRPCNFSGDVTFTTIEGDIECPRSLQFQDCLNGSMYYTTKSVSNPSEGEITQFMIFKSLVDGETRCISYIGIDTNIIGVNNIELIEGPIGFSNLGECVLCLPFISPTPSVTPTITPTPIVSPTPSPVEECNLYTLFGGSAPPGSSYEFTPCCGETQTSPIFVDRFNNVTVCSSSIPIKLDGFGESIMTGSCPICD